MGANPPPTGAKRPADPAVPAEDGHGYSSDRSRPVSPRRELLPGVRRRVWPSGTVTYEARWYDAGGRRHSEHYDTAAEVDAARQERLREHRRGGSGDPSGGRITLDAWWSRSSHRSTGGQSAGSSPATSCTGSRRRTRRPEAHAPLTQAHRRRLVENQRCCVRCSTRQLRDHR